MDMEQVNVWYLSHSGFAVSFKNSLFLFDYYLDEAEDNGKAKGDGDNQTCLDKGIVRPDDIASYERIYVFASHRHPDHFYPVILTCKEHLPQAQFFLSSDIPKKHRKDWTILLKPYENYEDNDIKIRTFKSTDEGVAFLVEKDNVVIYHAGDLNWWHWDEEPFHWNKDMEAKYKKEVSQIQNYQIDIAFLPTDPRQEKAEFWGISWFLEHVDVKVVFPMHFWDDYSIMDRIKTEAQHNPLFRKINTISSRGQHWTLQAGH